MFLTIRGDAVGIDRVVVVQRAVGVHVADIVGVPRVGRPERIATTLFISFSVGSNPRHKIFFCFHYELSPVLRLAS